MIREGHKIQFDIWDTAGQEKFRSIVRIYYQRANAALIVFDLTKRETFEKAVKWIDELRDQCDEVIQICLLGNKSDLVEEREIPLEEILQKCKEKEVIYREVSAKTGKGVKEAFEDLFNKIPLDIPKVETLEMSQPTQTKRCC